MNYEEYAARQHDHEQRKAKAPDVVNQDWTEKGNTNAQRTPEANTQDEEE